MKKLKYLVCFLLAAVMLLCMAACGGKESGMGGNTGDVTGNPTDSSGDQTDDNNENNGDNTGSSDDNTGSTEEPTEEKIVLERGQVTNIKVEHHGRTVDADAYMPGDKKFPIVIFSHGFNGYKDDFKGSAKKLNEEGIAAITFTFCGSGERDTSTLKTTEMTLFTEKEDLIAVMDYAKKIEGFNGNLFLAGGSQGGMVSAMAGEERQADVKGMMLLFPAFNIPDNWNSWHPDDDKVPETVEIFGVQLGKNFVLSMRDLDIYKNMKDFTKPVLLMHGTKDDIVPLSYSERAVKEYPNAQLVTYTGAGHGFAPGVQARADKEMLEFVLNNL